jgi:hypothetical protein
MDFIAYLVFAILAFSFGLYIERPGSYLDRRYRARVTRKYQQERQAK